MAYVSAAQLSASASIATEAQYGAYGAPVRINEGEGVGIYPSITEKKTLVEGGFDLQRDGILRLLKSQWADLTDANTVYQSKVELYLSETWVEFRVNSVTDGTVSGEWRLVLEPLH